MGTGWIIAGQVLFLEKWNLDFDIAKQVPTKALAQAPFPAYFFVFGGKEQESIGWRMVI